MPLHAADAQIWSNEGDQQNQVFKPDFLVGDSNSVLVAGGTTGTYGLYHQAVADVMAGEGCALISGPPTSPPGDLEDLQE